jgi:hypothetical protein
MQSKSEVGRGAIPVRGDLRGTQPVEGPVRDVVAMDVANSSEGGNSKGGAAGKSNLSGEGGAIGSINHSILEVSPFGQSKVIIFNLILDGHVLVTP